MTRSMMAIGSTWVTFGWKPQDRLTGATVDERLASLMERLDRSWFRTQTRARTPDRDRIDAKHRRMARGLRLASYWYHRSRATSGKGSGP